MKLLIAVLWFNKTENYCGETLYSPDIHTSLAQLAYHLLDTVCSALH